MNLSSIFGKGSTKPTSNSFSLANLFGGRGNRSMLPAPKEEVDKDVIKVIGGSGNRARLFQDRELTGYLRRIPRPSGSSGYEAYEKLSSTLMQNLPPEQLRNVFVNNNPNVSRALNDFRKFINPGWTLQPEGHPLFSRLFDNMGRHNEDINTLINSLSDSLYKDGASFTEIIFNDDNDPRRIVGIPAYTAEFIMSDGEDGEFEELGQYDPEAEDFFRSFHGDPTFKYYPLLPEVGNPYGRLIMDSAIYHLMMVKGFFQDYKDAISSIIWPNLLMSIDREQLAGMNQAQQSQIVQGLVEQVNTEIGKLEPGGILTFGSEVQISGYISGMNQTNLGAVTDCINIMNNEIMRALESESVLFGMTEGLAETHVTQQMRNYGYFINLGQGVLNKLFTHYFNLILTLNDQEANARFKLKFAIAEERLQAAKVYLAEREALKAESDDMLALVQGIESAKEFGYFDEQQAKEYFDEQIARRREVNLYPGGFGYAE